MTGLNVDVIRKRVEEIEESVTRLEEFKDVTKEEFLSSRDLQDIASYRLLVAIEASLNICYHVCAREIKRVPRGYAECFAMLGESGIIGRDLSQSLQKMAKFRNILVHLYWEVDHEMVWDFIQQKLEDLRQYIREIGKLL